MWVVLSSATNHSCLIRFMKWNENHISVSYILFYICSNVCISFWVCGYQPTKKYCNIFCTRGDLTHNMKSFQPHCHMLDFKRVKGLYFLLQTAECVECEFLSILEMWPWDSNWLLVQNSVIYLIFFFAPHPLPFGTLKSVTDLFIFQGKKLNRK